MQLKIDKISRTFTAPTYAVFFRSWWRGWIRYDDIEFKNYAEAATHLQLIHILKD